MKRFQKLNLFPLKVNVALHNRSCSIQTQYFESTYLLRITFALIFSISFASKFFI
jgi:hypothetical protein